MQNLLPWLGLFLSIGILLIGSRIHIGLSFISGGLVLGLFTLQPYEMLNEIYLTISDPSVVVLALALTMIPIIGGLLRVSGELDNIIRNLRVNRRAFLGISPALLGSLPIPGGALFSAPLVEGVGENLRGDVKTGVNIWFRHVLLFIYPLAPALIIPTKIAGLSVYSVLKYQLVFFLISIGIGYLFLLRKVKRGRSYSGEFSIRSLFPPLFVILIAPLLDYILQRVFVFEVTEISTFIAIFCSLSLLVYIVESRKTNLKRTIMEMKPWNFTVLLLGIFLFINIFKASGIGDMIAYLPLSLMTLSIGLSFLLGVATGRIDLPASIIFPILLSSYGFANIPPLLFSIVFFSIFAGYVVTPIHPCVGLSLEYYNSTIEKFLKIMIPPVGVCIVIVVLTFILFV